MRVPVFPSDLVVPLAGYLVFANLLALGLSVFRRAGSSDGEWGGYETRTVFLAVMGGWPGAMLGRMLFRPKREIRGFGLILGGSVFVLPVVVALPFLLRAMPGWIPSSDAKGPTQLADTTVTGAAASPVGDSLLAAEVPAGKLAGSPAATEVASTVPPPRPENLASAGSTGSSAASAGSTSGSSAAAPTMAATSGTTSSTTSSPTGTSAALAQSSASAGTGQTTSGGSLRQRVIRARRLKK